MILDYLGIGKLFYLLIIFFAVAGTFIISFKLDLSRQLQSFCIWALLFFGLIGVYGFWETIEKGFQSKSQISQFNDTQKVVIKPTSNGHFFVELQVNGQPTLFLIDTGATKTILSQADFSRLGLLRMKSSGVPLSTANGIILATHSKSANLSLGNLDLGEHQFLIVEERGFGPETSLVGMDIIAKFKRFAIDKKVLTLYY